MVTNPLHSRSSAWTLPAAAPWAARIVASWCYTRAPPRRRDRWRRPRWGSHRCWGKVWKTQGNPRKILGKTLENAEKCWKMMFDWGLKQEKWYKWALKVWNWDFSQKCDGFEAWTKPGSGKIPCRLTMKNGDFMDLSMMIPPRFSRFSKGGSSPQEIRMF